MRSYSGATFYGAGDILIKEKNQFRDYLSPGGFFTGRHFNVTQALVVDPRIDRARSRSVARAGGSWRVAAGTASGATPANLCETRRRGQRCSDAPLEILVQSPLAVSINL